MHAACSLPYSPLPLLVLLPAAACLQRRLLSRFGIKSRLQYYNAETLQKIVTRSAGILQTPTSADAAMEIAGRSRGTPRIANGLAAPGARFCAGIE